MSARTTPWWGKFELPMETCARWRIGPTAVWLQRLPGEWRMASERLRDGPDDVADVMLPADAADLTAFDDVVRFGVSGESVSVRVEPRLADRPVITRPEHPFRIPGGETVAVFVGSPLWFAAWVDGGDTPLTERPILRPSDTWFGPNTRTGELGYASRTACRLRLAELRVRPHRAVTRVEIRNRTSTELVLERMQLPAEHLRLFHAEDGALWTQDVVLDRSDPAAPAEMNVKSAAPSSAPSATPIGEPRKVAEGNLLVRAFGALFD